MSDTTAHPSSTRLAIVEALRLGAPGALDDKARQAFLTSGANIVLAELGMDSLGEMEFCIAIELATGVALVPSELADLKSTDAIERRIQEALRDPTRGDGTGR